MLPPSESTLPRPIILSGDLITYTAVAWVSHDVMSGEVRRSTCGCA